MNTANPLLPLREVLVVLYPTIDDSKVLLDDAVIAKKRIKFDEAAETNWFNILEEAQRQDKIGALLDRVAADYGKRHDFVAARQAYMDSLTGQSVPGDGVGFSLRVPSQQTTSELRGRDQLVSDLADKLQASQCIALSGIPGVGKTSLALALANHPDVAAAFPDGRAWIALGPSPQMLVELGRLMDQFGLPSAQVADEEARVKALRRALEGKRFLLVLDAVWKPEHVQLFLDACRPPACILLTTRNAQLADDLDAVSHPVPVLDPKNAEDMLKDSGDEARQAVEADHAAALDLVEDLGCLPLALKVAGRYLNRLARSSDRPEGAVAALRREFAAKSERLLGLTIAEVELSLEVIISTSYDALPGDHPDRRQAFRRLAVFGPEPLTFTSAAMAAVWEVGDLEASDLRRDLIEASLLQRVRLMARDDDADGEPQPADQTSAHSGKPVYVYTVQPVIAALAAKLLEQDSAEVRVASLAHGKFYAAIVKDASEEIRGKDMAHGLARLDREIDQVRRAVAWAQKQPGPEPDPEKDQLLRDLVVPLRSYAVGFRSLYREYGGWLDACREACGRLEDKHGLVAVLRAQGDVSSFLQQHVEALKCYEQALKHCQEIGDRPAEAKVCKALGDLALRAGDLVEAGMHYQAALDACKGIGVCLEAADALRAMGDLALRQSDLVEAGKHYQAALANYQAIDDGQLGEANTCHSLGDLALRKGDLEEAEKQYRAALEHFHAMNVRLGEANAHWALGDVALRQNKLDEAEKQYHEALTDFQAIYDCLGEANTLKSLGDLALRKGDLEEAEKQYRAALKGYKDIGNGLGEAITHAALGDLARRQNKQDEAKEQYQIALAGYQEFNNLLGQANTLADQGQLALTGGEEEKARGLLEQAVAIFTSKEDRYSVAAQTGRFGLALQKAGRREQAIPYLRQAAELFEKMGRQKEAERYRQAAEEAPEVARSDAATQAT